MKERDGHFTARGQRARYTVADCAPIAVCGSRPAFVDPRGTLSCARAQSRCFHAPRRGGGMRLPPTWKAEKIRRALGRTITQRGVLPRNSTLRYILYLLIANLISLRE